MSIDDVQIEPCPPRKRQQLHAADARHLAIWASDESLTPSDRRRAQEERDRRKQITGNKVAGVLVGPGGASPEQVDRLAKALKSVAPTEVHHPYCSNRIHAVCRATRAPLLVRRGDSAERMVARAADVLIALVDGNEIPVAKTGLWEQLRYAKDRGAEVHIIWPTGETKEGRW